MAEESEISIPIGLDPSDTLIGIEEAEKIANYYRCPECLEFLAVRKGDVRAHYFAHYPKGPDTPECKLRSAIGFSEWVRDNMMSPEEKLAKAHEMKLVLLREDYSDFYDIVGVIPSFDTEDFKDNDELSRAISSLSISGESIDGVVYPEAFHPSEPEVRIRLKPDVHNYSLRVSSGIVKSQVLGVWRSTGIKPKDVFIGDERRAERKDPPVPLREGELIYYALDKSETEPAFEVEEIQVGNVRLIRFEVRREIEDAIEELLPKVTTIGKNFTVDLLLPIESNPHITGPIEGSPKSDILISIVPPPGRNFEFEIVSIPASSSPVIPLPATIPDEPRYFQTQFPTHGSKKMSVHYHDRHVYLQFHSSVINRLKHPEESIDNVDVYALVVIDRVRTKIYPWNANIIKLEKSDNVGIDELIELIGPHRLVLELESRKGGGKIKRASYELGSIVDEIRLDYSSGFRAFTIYCGTLGRLDINIVRPKKLIDILTEDEIKKRITSLNVDPSEKINTKLLRAIVGTSSNNKIPGGLKKKVRKVMEKMRRGGV